MRWYDATLVMWNETIVQSKLSDDLDFCRRVIGWHAEPFVDVFFEVLRHVDEDRLKNCRVLEIGASRRSALSLFFFLRGSYVDITAHLDAEVAEVARFVAQEVKDSSQDKTRIRVFPLDVHELTELGEYDIIIMKAVLGGLDRTHNLRALAGVLQKCGKALKKEGHLIILDKGYASLAHNAFLRRYGAAGKNSWHYFTNSEIKSIFPSHGPVKVFWAGFLSFAAFHNRCLQEFVDFIDRVCLRKVLKTRGTVFAAIYTKDKFIP